MRYFVGVHVIENALPMARKDWQLEVEVEAQDGDHSARDVAEAVATRWIARNIGPHARVVSTTWIETRPFEPTVKVLSGPPIERRPR